MLTDDAIRAMAEEVVEPFDFMTSGLCIWRSYAGTEAFIQTRRSAEVDRIAAIIRRHLLAADASHSPPFRDTAAERVPGDDRLTRAVEVVNAARTIPTTLAGELHAKGMIYSAARVANTIEAVVAYDADYPTLPAPTR